MESIKLIRKQINKHSGVIRTTIDTRKPLLEDYFSVSSEEEGLVPCFKLSTKGDREVSRLPCWYSVHGEDQEEGCSRSLAAESQRALKVKVVECSGSLNDHIHRSDSVNVTFFIIYANIITSSTYNWHRGKTRCREQIIFHPLTSFWIMDERYGSTIWGLWSKVYLNRHSCSAFSLYKLHWNSNSTPLHIAACFGHLTSLNSATSHTNSLYNPTLTCWC